tara:strand:+ start:2631 stop:2834 length:204 start_codon:yes stop_codon:yes gene_type:complete
MLRILEHGAAQAVSAVFGLTRNGTFNFLKPEHNLSEQGAGATVQKLQCQLSGKKRGHTGVAFWLIST